MKQIIFVSPIIIFWALGVAEQTSWTNNQKSQPSNFVSRFSSYKYSQTLLIRTWLFRIPHYFELKPISLGLLFSHLLLAISNSQYFDLFFTSPDGSKQRGSTVKQTKMKMIFFANRLYFGNVSHLSLEWALLVFISEALPDRACLSQKLLKTFRVQDLY